MEQSKKEALLKENVVKPGSSFQHYLGARMTMTEFKNLTEAIMFVEEEEIQVRGETRKVRRLYIRPPNSDFVGVGWIINEDITGCMVCGESFGLFRWPHHCRSCGNLVCHPCSPESVIIVELEEMGPVRVCVQCYWGQDPVHAMHIRKQSVDEETEEGEGALAEHPVKIQITNSETNSPAPPLQQETAKKSKAILPKPIFAVFTTRKLSVKDSGPSSLNSRNSNRVIFVNICVHQVVDEYPMEVEFVVSDDIYTYKSEHSQSEEDPKDSMYEIYHVVLRPELLSDDALVEDEEQCQQAAEAILISLSEKFGYRLSKKFTLLREQRYIGDKVQEISLPPVYDTKNPMFTSPSHYTVYAQQDSAIKALESINPMDDKSKEFERNHRRPIPSGENSAKSTIEYEKNPLGNRQKNKDTKDNLNDMIEQEYLEAAAQKKTTSTSTVPVGAVAAGGAAVATLAARDATKGNEEEAKRKAAEEEAKRKAAEEEAKRKTAEEEAKRKAAEEEAKRKAAEEEAKRKAAEEAKRKAAEEEAKRKAAEEEAKRKAAEEEAKRKAAEEEARRLAAEKAAAVPPDELVSAKVDPVPSIRPSSIGGYEESMDTLFIPAKTFEPLPSAVLKTKREDGTKIFVNICHHPLIPTLDGSSPYASHPHYQDYLQSNFTQFTLNKARFLMNVGTLRETADKEGGTCYVSDVIVHSSVLDECNKDPELNDKFYLKVLKALARHNNTDFDADYKLPKILKNYKGNDVQKFTLPAYSSSGRPIPLNEAGGSRNSFRARPSEASMNSKLFGSLSEKKEEEKPKESKESKESATKEEPAPTKGPAVADPAASTTTTTQSLSAPAAVSRPSLAPGYVPPNSSTPFPINFAWNTKWKQFLPPNVNVVHTSVTTKKNAIGMKIVRQLILTDEPNMIYIDNSNNTMKGNIPFEKGNPPKAVLVDKQTFTVEVPGRVYKFVDNDQNAALWVQRINAVVAHFNKK